MELLEGQTLKQTISGKRLPLEIAIDFGIQIAGAINAAHSNGIVHRDIKPANIFVLKAAPDQGAGLWIGEADAASAEF